MSELPDGVIDAVDELGVFAVVGLLLRHLQDAVGTTCYARRVVDDTGGVGRFNRVLGAVGVAQYALLW